MGSLWMRLRAPGRREIFAAAGFELRVRAELIEPGTDLGRLTGPLAELAAFAETRLIAPACHDTASAIAGIPAVGDDWAYLSSGTWSLVGTLVRCRRCGRRPRRSRICVGVADERCFTRI